MPSKWMTYTFLLYGPRVFNPYDVTHALCTCRTVHVQRSARAAAAITPGRVVGGEEGGGVWLAERRVEARRWFQKVVAFKQ